MNELAIQQTQMDSLNKVLKEFKEMDGNIIGNETYTSVPPPLGFIHSFEVVNICKDPKFKEVYPQKGGGLSITAVGLKKLGKAMGIRFGPGEVVSRTYEFNQRTHSIIYRSQACVRGLDGQFSFSTMDYEFDLQRRMEEIENTQRQNVKYWKSGQPQAWDKAPPDFKVCKTPEEIELWVKEKIRIDMIQIEKNALTRAQTGAMTRCIRDLLSLPSTFLPEQLDKPFLVPKLVVFYDPINPMDRAFALEQTKVPMMMYPKPEPRPLPIQAPQQPNIALQAPPVAIPIEYPRQELNLPKESELVEIDQMMDTHLKNGEMPYEEGMQLTVEESALMDFEACEELDQIHCISELMMEKKWKGNLTKAVKDFTPAERKTFFLMLFKMASGNVTEQSTLPWSN